MALPKEEKRSAATQPKPVPEFASIQEEAEFWDTHDTTEYGDWEEIGQVEFIAAKPDGGVWCRLDDETLEALTQIARQRRTFPQLLARDWLRERIAVELHHMSPQPSLES